LSTQAATTSHKTHNKQSDEDFVAHFAIPYRQAEVTNLSMQEKQKSANCVIKAGALCQKDLGTSLFLQLAGHNNYT